MQPRLQLVLVKLTHHRTVAAGGIDRDTLNLLAINGELEDVLRYPRRFHGDIDQERLIGRYDLRLEFDGRDGRVHRLVGADIHVHVADARRWDAVAKRTQFRDTR